MQHQGQGPYLVQGHITWGGQDGGWSLETWLLRTWTPDSLQREKGSERSAPRLGPSPCYAGKPMQDGDEGLVDNVLAGMRLRT